MDVEQFWTTGNGQRATSNGLMNYVNNRVETENCTVGSISNVNFADASSRERELNFGRDSDSCLTNNTYV
jgi:hypothetical protein